MNQPSGDHRPPLAVAMQWISQITTIVMEMVLPGLAGQWLDNRWGTGFIALLGFGVGIAVAITHLIAISKQMSKGRADQGRSVSLDERRSQDSSSDSSTDSSPMPRDRPE
jgi:hypothetical protein